LPLYDPLDDNNIETFRRRFAFDTFGAPPIPLQFDERFYALRSGLASYVTSPSTEIAGDLAAARLGIHQRWQTKRGAPDRRKVVDWIVLDTDATIFPDPKGDNFGQWLGLVDYNFQWHVGDRTTLVSDGFFDFFSQGPKYFTIGGFLNRPPRGSWYAGIRVLEGPISSTVLASAYSYRMSDKWVSTYNSTWALGSTGNIGQNFAVTRIGESFLSTVSFNYDASKGNFGANFAIEPRFLPRGRLGPAGGVQIPVAGAFGLE
jgi:hypothetical protein